MKTRGIFITFEGMDGSGKTTQMHRLAERLRSLGRTVMETVEPGGPPIAQKIRRILLDSANLELSPTTEILLYFASRAQNVDEWILPALARGEIVLSDRFTDSSLVYQGVGRGFGVGTRREHAPVIGRNLRKQGHRRREPQQDREQRPQHPQAQHPANSTPTRARQLPRAACAATA